MLAQQPGLKIRRSRDRGHVKLDWLDTYHTFSFGEYHDSKYMGFRTLRVINEDTVSPKGGFPTHPHNDMEIITYVMEGALEHKDSMGNGSVIKAGSLQRMTAGTGVRHSEFNPSAKNRVRLLQIWILPDEAGLKPSYQELSLKDVKKDLPLTLVASKEDSTKILKIHQDVNLYLAVINEGEPVRYKIKKGRGVWFQAMEGAVNINEAALTQGDGAAIEGEGEILLSSKGSARGLLFDLK